MNDSDKKDEILNKIKGIIFEAIRINPEEITMESRLFPDLGVESIDVIDIRFRMEQMFGFKIGDREIIRQLEENISKEDIMERFTVGSIVDYVMRRYNENVC